MQKIDTHVYREGRHTHVHTQDVLFMAVKSVFLFKEHPHQVAKKSTTTNCSPAAISSFWNSASLTTFFILPPPPAAIAYVARTRMFIYKLKFSRVSFSAGANLSMRARILKRMRSRDGVVLGNYYSHAHAQYHPSRLCTVGLYRPSRP